MASTPSILIEQVDASSGVAGQSRTDLVISKLVTCTDSANASGSYTWTLLVPKGSSTTLSGASTATATFTPDITGNYLVFCAVDGATSYTIDAVGAWVSTQGGAGVLDNGNLIPTAGETTQFDSTEGWADNLDTYLRAISAIPGASQGEVFYADSAGKAAALAVGSAGQVLTSQGAAANPQWTTVAGTGDVTAAASFDTDNVIIRADGTAKGVQKSGIAVNDSGTLTTAQGILFTERADHVETPAATKGELWCRNSTPNVLVWTDDAGTDTTLGSGGSGTHALADSPTDITATYIPFGKAGGGGLAESSGLTWSGTALGVTGNITVSGTVDGRDVATDGTKLDGVEASADVTDATNVAAAGAVMDADFSAGEGWMRKTGAGTYEALKTNLAAAVAPTTTDDTNAGYAVGSIWINTTADKAYVCLDATAAAAVWTETTQSGTGSHAASHTNGTDDIQDATAAQKGLMTLAYAGKLDGIEASADVTDATNVAAAGAVMDSDISPGEGILRKTGSGTYTAHKTNLAASVAPTTTDDTNAGYSVGSLWIDTTADKAYVCLDATAAAAVWTEITQQSGSSTHVLSASPTDITATYIPFGKAGGGGLAESSGLTWSGTALGVTGNITVSGTVDGRDLATDGSKLDGVEASADVTDATNVAAAGAMMDSDISPAEGILRKTGSGTYTAHKTNLAAAVAPTTTDDGVAGYSVGSLWIDTTADKSYICVDSTTSAAVWNDLTSISGALTAASIDTLAELNAIVTDATLIDTGDSRLSDARTPTSHASSHVTGAGDAIQSATAAQNGLATSTQISKLDGIEASADVTDATNVAAAGAMMDSDISAAEGFLRKTGAGAYEAIKSNLGASVAPTANEDSGDGYAVGSLWIDTTADKVYQCADATVTAAVWKDLTGAGSGDFSGPASSTDNAIVRFDGGGGKTGQNSGVTINDSGTIVTAQGVSFSERSDHVETPTAGRLEVWVKSTTPNVLVATTDSGVDTFMSSYMGTLTDGATITPNCHTDGLVWVVTLAGNRTMAAPTNGAAGMTMVLKIIQDGTGSRTLSWNSVYKWPGGTAPTLTTTASAVDIVSGVCDGTNWYCSSVLDVR